MEIRLGTAEFSHSVNYEPNRIVFYKGGGGLTPGVPAQGDEARAAIAKCERVGSIEFTTVKSARFLRDQIQAWIDAQEAE